MVRVLTGQLNVVDLPRDQCIAIINDVRFLTVQREEQWTTRQDFSI